MQSRELTTEHKHLIRDMVGTGIKIKPNKGDGFTVNDRHRFLVCLAGSEEAANRLMGEIEQVYNAMWQAEVDEDDDRSDILEAKKHALFLIFECN